jgi:nicotinate-nucleotide pyrophosphorylase (carboxylating)
VHQFQIDPIVAAALSEDIGHGDLSTDLLPGAMREVTGRFVCKESGVLCGGSVAMRCFEQLDPQCRCEFSVADGSPVRPGEMVGAVQGSWAAVLGAERVALNFLQRMSGIASKTRRFAERAAVHGIRIAETRKTTPGLRILEKYAVRCGGGFNHRMDLSDAVMLKDNHFACAGIAPGALVERARKLSGHTVKIVAEAVTVPMAQELAAAGADVVLLDNMSPALITEAVAVVAGRSLIEVSGGITEQNLDQFMIPGVQVISIGALTHSYDALDISLEVG